MPAEGTRELMSAASFVSINDVVRGELLSSAFSRNLLWYICFDIARDPPIESLVNSI